MATLFEMNSTQSEFQFPRPLVDNYQPHRVEDFLCDKPRKVMTGVLRNHGKHSGIDLARLLY
jgi:hypothetical protein